MLDRIMVDIQRLAAQQTMAAATPDGYREGGRKYLALVEAYCLAPKPTTDRCEELAYNAGAAFLAGDDRVDAEKVLALMRAPKNGMSRSELTRRLACKLDPAAGCMVSP
jgi:hypothetical protein